MEKNVCTKAYLINFVMILKRLGWKQKHLITFFICLFILFICTNLLSVMYDISVQLTCVTLFLLPVSHLYIINLTIPVQLTCMMLSVSACCFTPVYNHLTIPVQLTCMTVSASCFTPVYN